MPASLRKLDFPSSSEDESNSQKGDEGFRFIDVGILSEIMRTFWCPDCRDGHVVMKENLESKKGFATQLTLECTARNCIYSRSFYTSRAARNGKAFEVNRRAVLAGRNIGIGHIGLSKFAGPMNMPPTMNDVDRDHVAAINAAELVCKESMNNASQQTKQFYEVEEDGKYDIGISADGTLQRREYSSLYGVVSGISLVAGKVLDVEIMSKECRECVARKRKEGTEEFQEWWEGHQHQCHSNFEGSSGAMDLWNSMTSVTQRFLEMGTVKRSIW